MGAVRLRAIALALLLSQAVVTASAAGSETDVSLWTSVADVASPASREVVRASRFRTFRLDHVALGRSLAGAPLEGTPAALSDPVVIPLPRPDGALEDFAVFESPVMEPGLATAHPEIRTYAGRSVEDPLRTVRLASTPLGLDAQVLGGDLPFSVEPRYADGDEHASYHHADSGGAPTGAEDLEDVVGDTSSTKRKPKAPKAGPDPAQLRTYRLALVSDPTYAEEFRDPAAPAGEGFRTTAAKVMLVSRVTHIFEQEWGARLVLIAGNDRLNLDTPALASTPGGPCGDRACFTEAQLADKYQSLGSNPVVTGLLVGARHFDVGHLVTGRQYGGVAWRPSVGGRLKAGGVSGAAPPRGHYMVGVFAHELGHQFGGAHTWSTCNGTRALSASAVEPGSGQTILGYSGICGVWDDYQVDRDLYFSFFNRDEFDYFAEHVWPPASAQQNIRLRGFGEGDSYRLAFGGGVSEVISFSDHTATGLKAAIEAIPGWPEGATVAIPAIDPIGVLIDFGGSLAGVPVDLLEVVDAIGTEAIVGERVAGGPLTNGGTLSATGNHVPVVQTASHATIPVRTPFVLAATGVDPDGDAISYLWEQTDGTENGGPWYMGRRDDVQRGPLFAPFPRGSGVTQQSAQGWDPAGTNTVGPQPVRVLPDVGQILADESTAATGTCTQWVFISAACYFERLPTAAYVGTRDDRTLGFRVTARDHRPGGAGIGYAETTLTLDPTAGPFRVTSPASAEVVQEGSALHVTWQVNGTERLAEKVTVTFSPDRGASFPVTLSKNEANDGFAVVQLPAGLRTEQGVVRVGPADGVWFDLGRGIISVRPGLLAAATPSLSFEPAAVGGAVSHKHARFSNAGSVPLGVGTIALQGAGASAYRIVDDGCTGAVLAPGKECKVKLAFEPSATGRALARLVASSSDSGPAPRVLLDGEGL